MLAVDLKLEFFGSSPPNPLVGDEVNRVYFLNGSLLWFPVARPSDALRKRRRSLSLHFRLPPVPLAAEGAGEVGDLSARRQSGASSMVPLLNGERDLDPFRLREWG